MNTLPPRHPTQEDLFAFGLGKIEANGAETIQGHLQTCGDCRRVVAGMSADSFVGRLRHAAVEGVIGSGNSQSKLHPVISSSETIPQELLNSDQYVEIRELGQGGMQLHDQAMRLWRQLGMDRKNQK